MNTEEAIAEGVQGYLEEIGGILDRLPAERLAQAIYRLDEARQNGQTVFTCGNGGSAATAIHFACDLAKGALAPGKPPIKALSLCENIPLLTAWANDASYSEVFAQRLLPWVKPGDVLVAISGSGNSANVLNAVRLAGEVGATTIAFTGFQGGALVGMVDLCITVPCDCMEQIEDVHLLLCHLITSCLRELPVAEGAKPEPATTMPAIAVMTLDSAPPEI
ncbi:MAG: D-sedoheptulose-7-phosphate isomerase [Chloroflexota bacterium]